MKKCTVLIVAVITCLFLSSCTANSSNDEMIKADYWYHYKELDIVNVQNCLVSDAYVRVAGNVAVNYYPVCKKCHEHGNLSMVFADENNPVLETYYCECGGQTTVKIKIII